MGLPKVGNLAPDFKLLDQDQNEVSLKQFRDKKIVILYFYPKAMTPGCTVQACAIRDHKGELEKDGIMVLGVSPDLPGRLMKFREKENLNFTLLSDPDCHVAKLYGAYGRKKFMGREYDGILRTTFIIASDGKLKHIMDKVNTKTHYDDVMDIIKCF